MGQISGENSEPFGVCVQEGEYKKALVPSPQLSKEEGLRDTGP